MTTFSLPMPLQSALKVATFVFCSHVGDSLSAVPATASAASMNCQLHSIAADNGMHESRGKYKTTASAAQTESTTASASTVGKSSESPVLCVLKNFGIAMRLHTAAYDTPESANSLTVFLYLMHVFV